jgi:hypothetical protein
MGKDFFVAGFESPERRLKRAATTRRLHGIQQGRHVFPAKGVAGIHKESRVTDATIYIPLNLSYALLILID